MLDQFRAKVADSGRIVIPLPLRRAFGIADGDEVVFTRTDYGIQITTLGESIRKAQESVAKYVPANADLAAEIRDLRNRDGLGA